MKSLREIKAENAGYGDLVTWKTLVAPSEFGEQTGKVVEVLPDGKRMIVEYTIHITAKAVVNREKIVRVSR